jgi:hypothetical protein
MTRCALTLALVAFLLPFASADDFDQVRQREALLAQKWSREVDATLESSRRLERTDPAAARDTLQSALNQLRSVTGLSETVRTDLNRRLQARLVAIPTSAAQPRPIAPPRPSPAAGGTPIPPTFSSNNSPAGGVTDTAKSFFDKQKGNVAKSNEASNSRAAGFTGTVSGIQDSSVPTDRDIAFSPNHKEIAARRAPAVNPKEDAVMSALSSSIDGDFSGKNFRQALDYITQKTGLAIIPDVHSLKEANVEYDDPINFRIGAKIAVRTALKKILGDRGLSYTINEGTVNIVTAQRARESTVVRIYPIKDLVMPATIQPQYVVGPYGQLIPVAPNTFPPGTPGVTPSFSQQMGQTIADMVRTSVDPQYWAPAGPGTISYNDATGSLIVRASAEVHFMVNGALYRR